MLKDFFALICCQKKNLASTLKMKIYLASTLKIKKTILKKSDFQSDFLCGKKNLASNGV